jgi:23S rRNA (pseudouridine1915-N3)-methyltransferase
MRLLVAAVGKPRDPALATSIAEYEKRAARYWPLETSIVREGDGARPAGEVVRLEGERLAQAARGAHLVLCDERGDHLTSKEFAAWLQLRREAAQDLAFIIGGAHGIDSALRERALRLIALAPWTLPHDLARLVLAEQLYRSGTIVRGEPYHK